MEELRRRVRHASAHRRPAQRRAGSANVVSMAAVALIAGVVAVAIHGGRSHAPAATPAKPRDARRATVTASATTTVGVAPRGEAPVPTSVLEALRADARWRDLEFFAAARPPFVSVRALPAGTTLEARSVAESIAARDAAIAEAVRDLWIESFGPPPGPAPGDRPLVRLILPDRARFALAYDPELDRIFEASVATFCGADGTAYIGRSPRDTTEPFPCGESSMQSTCDLMSAGAAAAQLLLDARTRTPQSAAAPPRRAFWFERGLVLWLSGIETARGSDADRDPGHVATNRLHLDYIQIVRGSGRANADDSLREAARSWTIPRLLDLRSDTDGYRVVGPSFHRHVGRAVMWGFVHFLWNYDGGRYRETLRATLAADLRGEDATAEFRRAMAAIEPATEKGDWNVVQREFWWYWDKLLARGVGWKTRSRLDWWRTPTTPPEGRWAPPPPDEPEEHEDTDDEETK